MPLESPHSINSEKNDPMTKMHDVLFVFAHCSFFLQLSLSTKLLYSSLVRISDTVNSSMLFDYISNLGAYFATNI